MWLGWVQLHGTDAALGLLSSHVAEPALRLATQPTPSARRIRVHDEHGCIAECLLCCLLAASAMPPAMASSGGGGIMSGLIGTVVQG
jgi:hypothetical protein